MDKTWQFLNFLNSLENSDPALIEAVDTGFLALLEDDSLPTQQRFDLETFKKLTSFAARKKYAASTLKKLGQGSSRAAFLIDDHTILKMAINKKGQGQNVAEGDWGLHQMYDILPKLIDKDEDNDLWLIMERATPMKTPARFEQLVGMPWKDFVACVDYDHDRRMARGGALNSQKPTYYQTILDNEEAHQFFFSISDMMVNFNMPAYDLTQISSYGEVNGHPVLLDAGLTQGVWDEFYKRT